MAAFMSMTILSHPSLKAAIDRLKKDGLKGAVVGHCMGGSLAWLASTRDIGLLIAHLDAALDAVEERGGQGDEAVGGEAVGELLDVRVDAEDLLDDDESAAGLALGRRPVRAELESILGREVDHLSHRGGLLFLVVSVERAWRDRSPNPRSA